jgi:colanic acid biosynthesis glycosyl transferase WcaI
MKILVQGINFAPDLIGIAKYTTEMCAALAARGHDVHIITAPPYYPNWAVPAPYSATRYGNETIENITVTRCPLYVPHNPTSLRRLVHHASFAATSALPTLYYARRLRPTAGGSLSMQLTAIYVPSRSVGGPDPITI